MWCNDARGERECLQVGVEVIGKQSAEIVVAKKGLLVLLPVAKVDDRLGAIIPVVGEPGVDVVTFLVGKVVRCTGAAAIVAQLVDSEARVDDACARQAQVLVIPVEFQEELVVCMRVAKV